MSADPIITASVVVQQQPPPFTTTTTSCSSCSSSSSSNVPFNSVINKQQCSDAAGDNITIKTTSNGEMPLSRSVSAFSSSTSYDSEEEERLRQLTPVSEDSALGADSYDDCDPVDETSSEVLYSNLDSSQQSSSLSVSTIKSIINSSRSTLETVTASSNQPKTILLNSATSAVTSNTISTSSEDHVIPPPLPASPPSYAMSAERATAIHSKSLTKGSIGVHNQDHNHRHHHHHSQQSAVDWPSAAAAAKSATNTAISSYRSKSISTSSTTSSGCGEDLEDQLVNSPEGHGSDHDHHHHHDSSPGSPDSGVSGSVNSPDDLKNTEADEEEEEEMHQDEETGTSSSSVKSRSASLRSGKHHHSPASTNSAISTDIVQHRQNASEVSSSKGIKKSNPSVEASNKSNSEGVGALKAPVQEAACKWHKCDWPGSYEELEDHIQDLHITLQPYYDENGKVIRWTKPPKRRANNSNANNNFTDETDETPCNSEPESEDEQAGSDDDDHSTSSASSMRITRRTGRLLADYSASGANSKQQHATPKLTRQSVHGGTGSSSSSSAKEAAAAAKQTSGNEFVCLWTGCKVYGVQSSKQWLERHVRDFHMGPNLHKCILAGCVRRFKTQNALQKHLETAHFSNQNGGNGNTTNGVNGNHHQPHNHHFYHLQQHHNFDQLNSIFGEGSRAQHAKQKICCACACHSKCMCFICDSENAPTSATSVTPTTVTPATAEQEQQKEKHEQQRSLRHRPATSSRDGLKNRCESTDSAISLNSHASSAEHCLPSTSTATTTSLSSSSSSKGSSLSDHHHQQHSSNCCKQYASAAFLKGKKKFLRRKKLFTPLPRPNTKFDFFGDQAAAMAIYAARQRRMQAAGIKYIYRMMERSDDGTLVEAKAPKPVAKEEESSSDEEEDEYKEFMSEDDSEDSESNFSDDEEEKKVNSEPEKKSRIFFCLDERLFSQNCTFTSKVINVQKSSSSETNLQLRWHPKGFFEDQWIKKCDHEYYRTRTVPHSVLPKSILQEFLANEQSASNGKNTIKNNKKKGNNKSTLKRSHSLTRNGTTTALGAEESGNEDGATPSTPSPLPLQRPKRLRRQL